MKKSQMSNLRVGDKVKLLKGNDKNTYTVVTIIGKPGSQDHVLGGLKNKKFKERDLKLIKHIPNRQKENVKDLRDSRLREMIRLMIKELLSEKAKSKSQQQFMGMVHAVQKGDLDPEDTSPEVRKAADTMKKKDVKDFAKTKHNGLPDKVKENITESNVADGKIISQMRDIVNSHQYQKINGKMVDAFTAQHVIHLYDALDDAHKEKLNNLKLDKLIALTWKMFKK